jgi:hypothetical protein
MSLPEDKGGDSITRTMTITARPGEMSGAMAKAEALMAKAAKGETITSKGPDSDLGKIERSLSLGNISMAGPFALTTEKGNSFKVDSIQMSAGFDGNRSATVNFTFQDSLGNTFTASISESGVLGPDGSVSSAGLRSAVAGAMLAVDKAADKDSGNLNLPANWSGLMREVKAEILKLSAEGKVPAASSAQPAVTEAVRSESAAVSGTSSQSKAEISKGPQTESGPESLVSAEAAPAGEMTIAASPKEIATGAASGKEVSFSIRLADNMTVGFVMNSKGDFQLFAEMQMPKEGGAARIMMKENADAGQVIAEVKASLRDGVPAATNAGAADFMAQMMAIPGFEGMSAQGLFGNIMMNMSDGGWFSMAELVNGNTVFFIADINKTIAPTVTETGRAEDVGTFGQKSRQMA